jgi:hypothetical protein
MMADRKLTSTIRSASALNLRYSADLMNLARNYIRDFSEALSSVQEVEDSTPVQPTGAPLLLAGRVGETANAAFAIRNSEKLTGTATLQPTGDFDDCIVTVDPERISFDEPGEKIVRILVVIGQKMPAGKDFLGTVKIKEFDHRITNFVLRKLG